MARRTVLSETFNILAVSATVKSGSSRFRGVGTSVLFQSFLLRAKVGILASRIAVRRTRFLSVFAGHQPFVALTA
jgi:hypothetical protein